MKNTLRTLVIAFAIAGAIAPGIATAQFPPPSEPVCVKETIIVKCDKQGNCVVISTTEPIIVDCP